ncbi:lipid A biosynthesis lauroyl acyltransferase [Chromobacterium violaceum]|uniref:Lipid A biosynthesis lauroyl acyltransferase n=1 Tax=Chromobacterium violaceum TaxID=536 RepID=A0A3S4IDA0_CHRVL|nr:lipid A biosynthesis lauroyl acyltransferase [Chromobacterium violaceum]
MTLVPRLAQMNKVTTLFFVGERLPGGQGFVVHIEPLAEPSPATRKPIARG